MSATSSDCPPVFFHPAAGFLGFLPQAPAVTECSSPPPTDRPCPPANEPATAEGEATAADADEEPRPPVLRLTPAQRLAWELLHVVGTDRRPSFLRAVARPQARVRCATALLRRALAQERRGRRAAARALWPLVDDYWRALARSGRVRRLLEDRASGLGLRPSEAGVVLAAVTDELLPGIHAVFVAGLPPDERHRTAHLAWLRAALRTAERPAPAPARLLLSNDRAVVDQAVGTRGFDAIVAAHLSLRRQLPQGSARVRLGTELAAALERPLQGLAKAGAATCTHWAGKLRAAAEAFPAPALFRLWGRVELRAGMAHLGDDVPQYGKAALAFARARVLESGTGEAQLFTQLADAVGVKVRSEITQAQSGGATLSAAGYTYFRGNEAALKEATGFEESAAGRTLRRLVQGSSARLAALRLGLDPDGPGTSEQLEAILSTVAAADPGPRGLVSLRQHLSELTPTGRPLPLTLLHRLSGKERDAILQGLSEAAAAEVSGEPVPDPTSYFADVFRGLAEAAGPLTEGSGLAVRACGLRSWLFAGHTVPKLAAAAGLVLLLLGGSMLAGRVHDATARDVAFLRLRLAAETNRSASLRAAARDYLAHADGAARDARFDEVASEYAGALMGEILRASAVSDTDQVTALLAEADALLRLQRAEEEGQP